MTPTEGDASSKPTDTRRVSRRHLVVVGLTSAITAAMLPAGAVAQPKTPKKLVQYQETPKGKQECDGCLHFLPPKSCKMVDGTINPKGWCALFAPKPK